MAAIDGDIDHFTLLDALADILEAEGTSIPAGMRAFAEGAIERVHAQMDALEAGERATAQPQPPV